MAIDTITQYQPQHKYPVYLKVGLPRHNDYKVGQKYDIRIEDKERQEEKGGEGPFNYVHEAILVGKEKCEYQDLPDILIAFLGNAKKRNLAEWNISFPMPPFDDDREVLLLTFLRLDKAKEYVENDEDVIYPSMDKSAAEGNGHTTSTE